MSTISIVCNKYVVVHCRVSHKSSLYISTIIGYIVVLSAHLDDNNVLVLNAT
jgi:hypothetical protein